MNRHLKISNFWLVFGSISLSWAWLLPNHYMPWTTFHSDAWTAATLLMISLGVIVRLRGPIKYHGVVVVFALLIVHIWLQYFLNQLFWFGTAWIGTAYFLGFLLLVLIGSAWEELYAGQVADTLFLAIGIASVISVGMQLYQWFDLDYVDVWIVSSTGSRPYANLGQPNELGTLLLWGMLAMAWGNLRGHIGLKTLIFASMFLLLGLALTRSRTGWIGLSILLISSWIWAKYLPDKRFRWVSVALVCYFAACLFLIDFLSDPFLLGDAKVGLLRLQSEPRLQLWRIFIEAALKEPVWGYGWNQVISAQLSVALDNPYFGSITAHSHNLFLDFLIWYGFPLGILISVYLVGWIWKSLCAVRCAQDVVLMLLILVVVNHAMFELPLHHGYFLFPVALIFGMLNTKLAHRAVFSGDWRGLLVLIFISLSVLFITARDYIKMEASYLNLRYEWARIKVDASRQPPDLIVLTQLREFVRFARFEPVSGMTDEELRWMERMVLTYPNSGVFFKYASALALNNKMDLANMWLDRMCKVVSEAECVLVKNTWIGKYSHNELSPTIKILQ